MVIYGWKKRIFEIKLTRYQKWPLADWDFEFFVARTVKRIASHASESSRTCESDWFAYFINNTSTFHLPSEKSHFLEVIINNYKSGYVFDLSVLSCLKMVLSFQLFIVQNSLFIYWNYKCVVSLSYYQTITGTLFQILVSGIHDRLIPFLTNCYHRIINYFWYIYDIRNGVRCQILDTRIWKNVIVW